MAKLYITFGQIHTHSVNGKTFDKGSVALVNCKDYTDGRRRAFEYFDDKWAFAYQGKPDMSFFPRGVIEVNPDENDS